MELKNKDGRELVLNKTGNRQKKENSRAQKKKLEKCKEIVAFFFQKNINHSQEQSIALAQFSIRFF